MPVAFEIPAVGTVVNATPVATLLGTVDAAGAGVYTVLGTVSTDLYESYEGTTVFHHVRLKIAGSWVDNADVVGGVRVSESVDTHTKTMTFALRGRNWSAWVTERTWTRAAVEIHIFHGSDPNDLTEETITGYVLTCSQSDDHESVVNVTCGDDAALAELNTICYELAPFAGLTVGEIFVQVMLLAGFASAEAPTGPEYTKPLQFTNRRPFEVMSQFIEPQGWLIRIEGSKVVAYEFDPTAVTSATPSDTWLPNQWETMKTIPPKDIASRWVVRGTSAVVVSEVGIESTETVTEIIASYGPVAATGQQDGAGVVTPVTSVDTTEVRVVSRITNTNQTRGGKTLATITEEWGWYNPRTAFRMTTPSYAYINGVWQTSTGEWTQFRRESFMRISRVTVSFTYASDGSLTQKDTITENWHREKNAAVRTVGTGSSAPTLATTYIYGDNGSYLIRHETWSVSEHIISTYNYDTTGAQDKLSEDLWLYYAPRARSGDDPPADSSLYILENGAGQTERHSSFILAETKITANILNPDRMVVGTITKAYGYRSDPQWFENGTDDSYDWGGGLISNQESESWRFLDSTSTAYTIINADQTEIVDTATDGRTESTHLGGPPLPRFTGSAWTELTQDEIEVVFEDATAQAWWGFSREVINHEFIQTIQEAEKVYRIRKARAMAHQVTVNRHPGLMGLGDVVRLRHPGTGLYRKAWVVGRDRSWDLAVGKASVAYKLEAPLG